MNINSPCQTCTGRIIMCHDSCDKYKQYKATQEDVKTKRTNYMAERSVAVESVLRQSKHKIQRSL